MLIAIDGPSSQTKFGVRGRSANEPSTSSIPQWTAVLWSRLERVMEDVANCCIKVNYYFDFVP